MRRFFLFLLLVINFAPLHAQPDTLDYRCDYYFSKRNLQEGVRVTPQNVVLLGNSLTERGAWTEYFQDARLLNRGIGGDCVAGMIARVDSIAAGNPRSIFLMAGVNDLIFSKIEPAALLRQYVRLLDKIQRLSPQTTVYIESLLPLDEAQNELYFAGKNTRIEAFNGLLRELASQRGITYIDLWSLFASDGRMPTRYTVDGIHLNASGYAIWVEALTPYITPYDACEGRVTCARQGVADVVVSDGVHCTVTDSAGRYTLPLGADSRFVFISTPAGYVSPLENNVVRYYAPIEANRSRYDFSLERAAKEDSHHGLIVVADPQVFALKEFEQLKTSAEDIRTTVESSVYPMYGLCVGDITSGDHSFYPRYNEVMAAAKIPFRYAMGNHDMKIWGRSFETSLAPFEAVYGPSYYSYNIGKVHYVVLNDNFFIGRDWYYIAYLEERQLAWLEEDLKYVAEGTTVIVGLHIPTMHRDKLTEPFDIRTAGRSLCNYKPLHDMLKPYNAHIVSGHMHTTSNYEVRPGLYEHNIPALSGAWWQGPICTDGTPAGYAVFDIDGSNVKWYYKSVGEPQDFQLKIYDQHDNPSFSGFLVANVWASDSSWRIEMRIDGGEPQTMTPFATLDPEAEALYSDVSKLEHNWIHATPADHFFRAPLPEGAHRVEVTATDRFGRVYKVEKKIQP